MQLMKRITLHFPTFCCDLSLNLNWFSNEKFSKSLNCICFGPDNSTLIQDSMSELTMYKDDLETKLAPYTQEAAERMAIDLQKMGDKLREHMSEAREQMEKYSVELQTMMEQNADDVRARVSAYNRKLKKRLTKDTEAIKRWVRATGGGGETPEQAIMMRYQYQNM